MLGLVRKVFISIIKLIVQQIVSAETVFKVYFHLKYF